MIRLPNGVDIFGRALNIRDVKYYTISCLFRFFVEMFALKIVRVEKREEQSRSLLDSYSNEIELLKRLKGNRFIISLENAEVC